MLVIKVLNIIKKMKLKFQGQEIHGIKTNIQHIQLICNNFFSQSVENGNAALNRRMLLDPYIANLLTPAVIQYLFTCKESYFLNRDGRQTRLNEAIYYGFADGLEVIRLMINNGSLSDEKGLALQKNMFNLNTMRIVDNILIAAGFNDIQKYQFYQEVKIENTDILNLEKLKKRFKIITHVIDQLKIAQIADDLIKVPGYSAASIRDQANSGFETIKKLMKDDYENFDEFAKIS